MSRHDPLSLSPITQSLQAGRMRLLLAMSLMTGLTLSPPSSAGAFPWYDLVPGALNPQACAGAGCWTNHLRLTDLDNDGDLDLVLVNYADFFAGGNAPQPLVIYRNDGDGTFTNVSGTAVGDYSGNLRQIAIGDVTGDGLRDMYAPQGTGGAHVLFINQGNLVFVEQAAARLPNDYPNGAAARMGDVDDDGDLDIIASDGYAVAGPPFAHLYRNDGNGNFSEVANAFPTSIAGSNISDLELLDADRDFDLDVVVNAHNGGIGALWLNDGNGIFTAGGSLASAAIGSLHSNVTPCDVDADGDLDLWVDNAGAALAEQLQINNGSGGYSDESAARVSGNPGSDDNAVACADIDNDADLDAVVISLGTAERFLQNNGSGSFALLAGVFPAPTNCSLSAEFGDLNGDGRIDLVTGQGECSSSDEVYFANANVPIDTRAPLILAVDDPGPVLPGAPAILRFAVSDSSVTDEGPRLDRAYAVVDPAGAALEFEAQPMGGDLFRVVLPATSSGSVQFQACATDLRANTDCTQTLSYAVDPFADRIFANGFETSL